MTESLGLRERKKQQTRRLIGETARRLFRERGFERVTVAEIAREADVSPATVFNYFPTKEDLFYSGMEAFEARLVAAVRDRPPGVSALAAVRDLVLEGTPRLADEEVADLIADAARTIASSRALRAREHELIAGYTAELADALRQETGAGDHAAEPVAVASALMAAQRAVVAFVHASVLAGTRGRALAEAARREAEAAFARLEQGLGDYAVRAG